VSYASLIGKTSDDPSKEIVEERVLIKAYAEATGGDIKLHVSPPISIGPSTHNAHDVRLAIFDEKRGGEPTTVFYCAPHIKVGGYVRMGRGKPNVQK
jgi:hypothetical protein